MRHFKDKAYFRPLLYDYIKKGECSPHDLRSIIDRMEKFNGK